MAQFKIYGLKDQLDPIKARLSQIIHACAVEALGLPEDKKFQRFFSLQEEDFVFPPNRSHRYTIIEISMFEGRSVETKKNLIRLLFQRTKDELDVEAADLEITIFETPRANWGIRGQCGDELELEYKVEI